MKTHPDHHTTPVTTDPALFGGQVAEANPSAPSLKPATYAETGSTSSKSASREGSSSATSASKGERKEVGMEISVLRLQQSLCLFPLETGHFRTHGHKLKYLIDERKLTPPERAAVIAELQRQTNLMAEALTQFKS